MKSLVKYEFLKILRRKSTLIVMGVSLIVTAFLFGLPVIQFQTYHQEGVIKGLEGIAYEKKQAEAYSVPLTNEHITETIRDVQRLFDDPDNVGYDGNEQFLVGDAYWDGIAPNSSSAETLSKALGSRTVMSGSVSRNRNDPSQSLQMMERPLLTPDELKSMPKGQFVVMKTGVHPMKVKLKLFFKWGIRFDEEHPYTVADNGGRKVRYAQKQEIIDGIIKKYHPELAPTRFSADIGSESGGIGQPQSPVNEPQQTIEKKTTGKKSGGMNPVPPKRKQAPSPTAGALSDHALESGKAGKQRKMSRFDFLYRMELPHRAVSVYVYLADRANRDGECWPAIPIIAAELKLSESTVRRALRDLRNTGLFETEQR